MKFHEHGIDGEGDFNLAIWRTLRGDKCSFKMEFRTTGDCRRRIAGGGMGSGGLFVFRAGDIRDFFRFRAVAEFNNHFLG